LIKPKNHRLKNMMRLPKIDRRAWLALWLQDRRRARLAASVPVVTDNRLTEESEKRVTEEGDVRVQE
jgi:hypothetical protein